MSDRDRLVALLKEADDATEVHDCDYPTYEKAMQAFYTSIADHLLANGVIVLPCAVGDTVYEIPSKVNYELNILNKLEEQNRVYNQKIKEIIFTKRGWYVTCDKYEEYGIGSVLLGEEFGESWFLTKEEAERKLKELEE